jgi:thiol-disulfide isomerase/thioredoxin
MRKLLLSLSALLFGLGAFAQQPYPELGAKLDQYFIALAGESASVQNEECDFLIETCQDSLVRQYTALKIYDHYLKSKIMGDDAVAVHVARKWFLSGAVKMKSDEDLLNAQIYVKFNESSLIGCPAPALTLFTPDSTKLRIPAKDTYSVLYFYDTGCSTCKRETPKLQKLVASEKYPINVYAIYVGASAEEWAAYRENFEGVTHLWDPAVSSDWQILYGVLQTPKMYLVNNSGEIVGRGLDTSALEILLNREFSKEDYVYGEEGEMERLNQLFSAYGDTLKVSDVMSVADYMAQRTFGEGDLNAYKQTFGDLLYYLFSQRTEVYRDASVPFIQKYIEQPEIWNTEADKAQITSLGELMVTLANRTPVGSEVPDLTVDGTLRRKPGLFRKARKEGTFKLRKLKGNPTYLVFYTPSCSNCKKILGAVDDIVMENRKAKVLLIDMDALYSDKPEMANQLLDNFDLSVLPFVIQLDRKGIVQHRYVQLLK